MMVYQKKSLAKSDYYTQTISDFGTIKEIRRIITLGCFIIGILNIPFSLALNSLIDGGLGFTLNNFSALTSISLVLTGLTVNKPKGKPHYFFSKVFFGVFYIFEALVSFKLLAVDLYWGQVLISILMVNLVTTIGLFLKQKKINGIIEISYLGFNSLWLLITGIVILWN